MVFGLVKALTNYFTGALANRFGRKNLLTLGWFFGIPVPFILMYAPNWNWIVAANVLLGINQGLAWSSTVVMKIDLVGENERGLAMGLNEFAGYLAVAVVAFLTGWIAAASVCGPIPSISAWPCRLPDFSEAGCWCAIPGITLPRRPRPAMSPSSKIFFGTRRCSTAIWAPSRKRV
jgi:MFS family permease